MTATLRERVVNLFHMFHGQPSRLADEAATEGRTALHAVALDTVEGDIQVSRQRDAWTTQIARLLDIDNRNRDQEYLLRQLRRNVRDLDAAEAARHATPEGLGGQRLAAFGAVGQRQGFLGALTASPALAILLSPWTWLVAVAAFALLQMGLKERIENQRDEARADLRHMEQSRDSYAAALGDERAQRARDVAAVLEQTAETVEQMRVQQARRAAREARERARREDLARGAVNFGERLRELARPEDAGLPAGPAAAPGGGPAGAVSTGAGGDADDGAHP